MRETQMGAKLGQIYGRASLGGPHRDGIQAGGSQMHVDLFEGVSGTERPTIRHLPVRGDLKSVSFPVHEVFVNGRNEQMGRSRSRFEKGGGRFDGPLVSVIAVKSCEVNRQ